MAKRRIYDRERHAHFVTYSCYRRRRLLDEDAAKRIVLGTLNAQLRRLAGRCAGFVLMPNHVHAIVWFPEQGQLSEFMKQWKRTSSPRIGQLLRETLTGYRSIQYLQPAEARGEADVHASQSCSRWVGAERLRLALELGSLLRAGQVRRRATRLDRVNPLVPSAHRQQVVGAALRPRLLSAPLDPRGVAAETLRAPGGLRVCRVQARVAGQSPRSLPPMRSVSLITLLLLGMLTMTFVSRSLGDEEKILRA